MPLVHIDPADGCDMRMGNYLGSGVLAPIGMSARTNSLGIRHPTVVPTNFEAATAKQSAPAADTDTAASDVDTTVASDRS